MDFDITIVYDDEEFANRVKRKLEEALRQVVIYMVPASDAHSFVAEWEERCRFMDAFVDLRTVDDRPHSIHVADLYDAASRKMRKATFVHLVNNSTSVAEHGCGLYLHRGEGNVSLAPHAAILCDEEAEDRLCRALVTTLVSSAIADDLEDLFGKPGQAPFTRTGRHGR